jgi:two-component system response regulator HydG
LFLDEIGELPLDVQSKLLRCIQERAVVPLGSVRPIPVDVRIVAATNRPLAEMAADGRFREDLYYRLNVITLDLPPLRQRRSDIPLLVAHFLKEVGELFREPARTISPAAMRALCDRNWAGNVRELRNAIERACALSERDVLTHEDFGGAPVASAPEPDSDKPHASPDMVTLAQHERDLLRQTLRATAGNQTEAARILDVERHRLHRLVVRHGLAPLVRSLQAGT